MRLKPVQKSKRLLVLLLGGALAGCLSSGGDDDTSLTDSDDTGTNSPPRLSGSPPNSVDIGDMYRFTPTASDPDGDPITFSIVNRPGWADFDSQTGELSGQPLLGNEGTYTGIRISASDGKDTASLSFSVTVMGANSGANQPPSLSGSPASTVKVGEPYQFIPTATDPDGDSISFSIDNLPSWASFNAQNGGISGTPNAGSEGPYNNITITASDGTATDTLMFSIEVTTVATGSVTLSWTPPTEYEDGSPLTDLAGFKLYYGTETGRYTETIDVDNPGISTYVVNNLTPNTYFFAATAYNSSGVESDFSEEVQKAAN